MVYQPARTAKIPLGFAGFSGKTGQIGICGSNTIIGRQYTDDDD
jgi:hypothetical protein